MLLAVGSTFGISVVHAHAQPGAATAQAAADVTGRDFAGLRLPGTVQLGNITLAGGKVWLWNENDAGGGASDTTRLLIVGDVRVSVGATNKFTAARATVWIQTLPDAAPGGGEGGEGGVVRTRQIAIYFDRVSDPGAGGAGFSLAGDRLLVTGLVQGEFALQPDSTAKGRPVAGPLTAAREQDGLNLAFLAESESRMARHLRKLMGFDDAAPAANRPERPDVRAAGAQRDPRAYSVRQIRPGVSRPYEPGSPLIQPAERSRIGEIPPSGLPPAETIEPIFAKGGVISFAVNNDRLLNPADAQGVDGLDSPIRPLVTADGESAVVLSGGVVVQYTSTRKAESLQISASRAVVFLAGKNADTSRFAYDAEAVKGIYLEGDVVATDGRYTLRGPKVYYDIANQQAVMVDAVFWTFDQTRGLPLYVRAKEIRQLASRQWQASDARLATTAFFDPVFSLGAREVTITQREGSGGRGGLGSLPGGPGGRDGNQSGSGLAIAPDASGDGATVSTDSTIVDARGITLRASNVPFFLFPRFRGDITNFPLRDVRIENSSSSGAAIKTSWDILGSLGLNKPKDWDLDTQLLVDFYFDRGPAFGNKSEWKNATSEGRLLAYTVPIDFGRDSLSSGAKRGRDFEFRGMILGEHIWRMNEKWALQLEGGIISDENFVDAFFKPLANEGREVTNAAYLSRRDDDSLFSVLAKGSTNDFTVNQYLLQSQGYAVDKLPEVAYFRLGDDLLPQTAPGMLLWSSEYRLSRMQLNFTEPTLDELGFDTPARARAAFGVADPTLSPADILRAGGYVEAETYRADTRQELSSTFNYGAMKISPFIAARGTTWDDNVDHFTPGSESEDNYRLWYSTGMRTSTQITRVNNAIDNSLFDIHRTRHIVEPNATVWYSGANVSQNDLPVYDDSVESLQTGAAVKAGIDQTWQTQRGGPGRWRSVDLLRVNASVVGTSDDTDRESPILRFFDYRPEYSPLGDFAKLDAAWQATDVLGFTFDSIYDLETHQPARTSAGGVIQHSPDFSSYAEARYINALDATYVNWGFDYKLTRRYSVSANFTYDTDLAELQSFSSTVRRKVPEANLGLSVGYNNITDDTSFGFVFEPLAASDLNRPTQRLRDIGR